MRKPEHDLLLGRERELAQLHDAYEAARAGTPVVMFVSGESGMGKSALCRTFLDELRAQGHAVVLAGRCYERESVPFKGIDRLVDDLSRYLRRLPQADAAALMPREVYALSRIFPGLGRIDAVAQAPKKDIVDPQELRLRAYGSVLRAARAHPRPAAARVAHRRRAMARPRRGDVLGLCARTA